VISTSSYKIKRRKLQPEREDVWDPGGPTSSELVKIHVPIQIYSLISVSVMDAGDEMSYDDDGEPSNEQSRMELDSHANMPVV
jgi:hypothetical protein